MIFFAFLAVMINMEVCAPQPVVNKETFLTYFTRKDEFYKKRRDFTVSKSKMGYPVNLGYPILSYRTLFIRSIHRLDIVFRTCITRSLVDMSFHIR